MLWSKQLFDYDVVRWLEGDPTQPAPPESRRSGRNAGWRTFDAFDIMSMPDKWEYPWFAAWDLRLPLRRPRARRSRPSRSTSSCCSAASGSSIRTARWPRTSGRSTINPPVHAWAALRGVAIDGARDFDFLERVFDKLLAQLHLVGEPQGRRRQRTSSRAASSASTTSGRSTARHLPVGDTLEQSDSTGVDGASTALSTGRDARRSSRRSTARPTTTWPKFLEHFALIADALNSRACGTTRTASSTTG